MTSLSATNPKWLAPEVLSGRPCTPASDVYAFGIILCAPVDPALLLLTLQLEGLWRQSEGCTALQACCVGICALPKLTAHLRLAWRCHDKLASNRAVLLKRIYVSLRQSQIWVPTTMQSSTSAWGAGGRC